MQLSTKLDTTRMGREVETEFRERQSVILRTQAGARLLEMATVLLPDMAIACTLQIASHQLPNGTDP
jgi:hypothetical protein